MKNKYDFKSPILSGLPYAKKTIDSIKLELVDIKNATLNYVPPKLAIIQIGNNDASNLYIQRKKKIANEIGFEVAHYQFKEEAESEDISATIEKLNHDPSIHGIILQLPISEQYKHLIYEIAAKKDIDGLGLMQQANLALKREGLRPCTPLGVINLMKYYNISFQQNMCIVGSSILVGQSLALMLLHEGATITITHSLTNNLAEHIKKADVIFLAAGVPGLVNPRMIKQDAVIIDIGITKIGNKFLGDFAWEENNGEFFYYTPVPGGVGPVTVATLMQNLLKAYKRQIKKRE